MTNAEVWLKGKIKTFAVKMFGGPKSSFIISYFYHRKQLPHLRNPKNLSEILIKRVIDGEIDKLYYLADKYLMRNYIEEKGLGRHLPKLLGVYEQAEDIDFDKLPERFALKMNFGAGMNIICTDKAKLNIAATKDQLNKWLKRKPIYSYAETHYNLIQRRIICEEFIDDGKGGFPVDYKFMCVKGEPMCCLVCVDRKKKQERYIPLSLNWNYLKDWDAQENQDNVNGNYLPHQPENFTQMLDIAKKMSTDIPFVRVDLYSNGKRIWIGELTLTPDGCIMHRWTMKALDEMGKAYRKDI